MLWALCWLKILRWRRVNDGRNSFASVGNCGRDRWRGCDHYERQVDMVNPKYTALVEHLSNEELHNEVNFICSYLDALVAEISKRHLIGFKKIEVTFQNAPKTTVATPLI